MGTGMFKDVCSGMVDPVTGTQKTERIEMSQKEVDAMRRNVPTVIPVIKATVIEDRLAALEEAVQSGDVLIKKSV